ncbi:monofunctional biosynthetic peptidoglycan transglycosylase [Arboricoccus pini]|uniref:Biosynthetic peptidoglycan transglycosylase n=1 Tax=Arboricoccus pini TaxID=1963835 RepID=A0A212QUA7_9PROT|nr:monofunctional biosynthetic peptidoglycan transglycosylase [Arboricoccus pini]SNB63253.1 monofunctional biosynthetic peptidoglycan transglycosylase [Arboricoccus pini]
MVQRSSSRALPPGRRSRTTGWLKRILLVLLFCPLVLIAIGRFMPIFITPLMVIRLAEGYGLRHDWVGQGEIAPELAEAVIASEDNLFCRHFGFDTAATRAQISAWLDGERPRGASTITMQTAKNLFLWPGRDPVRKLLEAWLTPQIELLWSKKRILEVYLNSVEFGPGIYGVQAAARAFFAKDAAHLTRGEASRLAAVLPAPLEWSAARPNGYVRQRAARIRDRMTQLGGYLDCVWRN